jgi:AcrR family transcriptional regulator
MPNARHRPYRKRKRALKEEETRRRITEAAVALHRTAGPAKTKVTDVADLAGVSRMTVYNHFPTEADLLEACSAHWASQNPFPDPARWTAVGNPAHRLADALLELYGWYRSAEDMLGKVIRDAASVPPLSAVMEARWWPYVDEMVRVLGEGWTVDPAGRQQLDGALRLAVDFNTWSVLTRAGLDDAGAAQLAARMVIAVANVDGPQVKRESHEPAGERDQGPC